MKTTGDDDSRSDFSAAPADYRLQAQVGFTWSMRTKQKVKVYAHMAKLEFPLKKFLNRSKKKKKLYQALVSVEGENSFAIS